MIKSVKIAMISVMFLPLGFGVPSFAQEPDMNAIVATVNGTEITVGHMLIARQNLPEQFQQLPDQVLFSGILDQLIQQTLLQQNFRGALPQPIQMQLENDVRSLTANEAINQISKRAIADSVITEIYNGQYLNAGSQKEYNASHILVDTEQEAQAIRAQIEAGADFANTARKSSTGPSGPGGGELGWFGAGRMVPEFERAVAELSTGEVSDPVPTQFGWHIIKLNETRALEAPTLADVREEIESQLRIEALEEYILELTNISQIERMGIDDIDPAVIGRIDLLQ